MGLFKRKNKSENKAVVNEQLVNKLPDYHKCVVCGSKVKNKICESEKSTGKYLDGQKKVSLDSKIAEFYCCNECGYIYDHGDSIKKPWVMDEIKKVVQSDEYQKIRKDENISETFKTLLLLSKIKEIDNELLKKLNQLWLDYYTDLGDEEKMQEYLLKRIEEVPKGLSLASDIYSGEFDEDFYRFSKIDSKQHSQVHINMNAVLTDLYRRSGQFEEARECINFAFMNYHFISQESILKKYYEYQLMLIEQKNKNRI